MNLSNAKDFCKFSKINPGEKVDPDLLEKLRKINANYSKTKCFPDYFRSIQQTFQIQPIPCKTLACQYFLAGFLEGEGSLSVGAKKNTSSVFRVYFDPEFNLTQHINGISTLYLAMSVFQTGRIRHKNGSNATFVYTIDNRQTLEEKVIPFYEKFVNPYGSVVKSNRVALFKRLCQLFREKAHLNLQRMVQEIIPLWDALRLQKGHSNESFSSSLEAKIYVQEAAQLSKKKVEQ